MRVSALRQTKNRLLEEPMKKIVSLALAMLLVLSLAACGSKNSGAGDVSDALTLLNTVWATYSEEEKFPVSGGDYDHPVDDAPGAFDISNADNMDDMLGFPGPSVANLVDAASLMHMMNANTFTCGAYHLSDDVSAADVASSLRDNIMNRRPLPPFSQSSDAQSLININSKLISFQLSFI